MNSTPKARCITVAPIEHGGLLRRVPTPIVFDDDVTIAAIPTWYRDMELPEFYPYELRQLQEDAEFAILVNYSTPAVTTQAAAAQATEAHARAYENVMMAQMAL